jgi:hypothetical protein
MKTHTSLYNKSFSGLSAKLFSYKTLLFTVVVLFTTVACSESDSKNSLSKQQTSTQSAHDMKTNQSSIKQMLLKIGDTVLTATLENNSSVEALVADLAKSPITIEMHDYGAMEKVGPLGRSYPRNDQQTTTKAGDLILYQGNAFVFYYAPNSWNFTRLGKIESIEPLTKESLLKILGDGNVSVTLSLP